MIRLGELLAKLPSARGKNGQWWALCPCHHDCSPSLSVRADAAGHAMAHCFACGAGTGAVLRALHLTPSAPAVIEHEPTPYGLGLRLARGQRWYTERERYALADAVRYARRVVTALHQTAQSLPSDLDATWELLARAQRIDDAIRHAETVLDH